MFIVFRMLISHKCSLLVSLAFSRLCMHIIDCFPRHSLSWSHTRSPIFSQVFFSSLLEQEAACPHWVSLPVTVARLCKWTKGVPLLAFLLRLKWFDTSCTFSYAIAVTGLLFIEVSIGVFCTPACWHAHSISGKFWLLSR